MQSTSTKTNEKSKQRSSGRQTTAEAAGSTENAAKPAYIPTDAERELAQSMRARLRAKVPAPHFKVEHKASNRLFINPEHADRFTGIAAYLNAFGTADYDFADWLLNHLINGGTQATHSNPLEQRELNGAAAAMAGIAPRNEMEAMLAAQMVAVHAAAIVALRRLKGAEMITQLDSNGNLAVKLLRTFTTQLETLQRLRGKGQQTVRVEHVTVNAGGQAIVGNVSPGGGAKEKSEEQPHAKQLAHAASETLPSNIEAHKEPVPVTSGSGT